MCFQGFLLTNTSISNYYFFKTRMTINCVQSVPGRPSPFEQRNVLAKGKKKKLLKHEID